MYHDGDCVLRFARIKIGGDCQSDFGRESNIHCTRLYPSTTEWTRRDSLPRMIPAAVCRSFSIVGILRFVESKSVDPVRPALAVRELNKYIKQEFGSKTRSKQRGRDVSRGF